MSHALRTRILYGLLALPGFLVAQSPAPAQAHAPGRSEAPGDANSLLRGTVLETMDSGGYTYIHLQLDGGAKKWAAIPGSKVAKGQHVTLLAGTEMGEFKSKTLNRTFDSIIFSPGLAAGSSPQAEPASPTGAIPPPKEAVRIGKAPGAAAYTIAEIHQKGAALAGKTVFVRGRVVKAAMGIMGRNWLHLQDGSGQPKASDYDLVVTTDEKAKVGETVTARGVVVVNQDFGAGYRYAVLIEKAVISRKRPSGL